MSVNAWIIVGDQPTVGNLITVARSLGGPVAAEARPAVPARTLQTATIAPKRTPTTTTTVSVRGLNPFV